MVVHTVTNKETIDTKDEGENTPLKPTWFNMRSPTFCSMKLLVLVILCLQNSLFTLFRRYSQGVLKETYSKHEVLLFGEVVKMVVSSYFIYCQRVEINRPFKLHLVHLLKRSQKMLMLSLIYGLMNILSYVALRNISAGLFTICAQLKILTTATFSTIMLKKEYSWVKWRALTSLMFGVLLFSEPVWNDKSGSSSTFKSESSEKLFLGSAAVLTEVTLSGFASIYFEKVIKTDKEQFNIWDRNFQLAFGSFPIYVAFILADGGGDAGYFGGWSMVTLFLAMLGSAGGLLVALSIKYGDAILKTLATTGAIVLSSVLDYLFLNGPLSAGMMLAGGIVIICIFDYSFDPTPTPKMIDPKATVISTEDEKTDSTATVQKV